MSSSKKPSGKKKKPVVRTRTPRPDELSRESFEFIATVDEYKRRHMRSFLTDEEILGIFYDLGYRLGDHTGPEASQLEAFAETRQKYRVEHGRLFPTWSEIFDLLTDLGYERIEEPDGGREAA